MQWPALREELALFPGPQLADGQPSWTLHDPTRNQFFRIDWLSFEIIQRWHLTSLEGVHAAIHQETTLRPDQGDIEAVIVFLQNNQLVRTGGGDSANLMAGRHALTKGGPMTWLLHHYLFFRVPLVRPDRWLDRRVGSVAPFYSRRFAQLCGLALALGLILVYRDWTRFSATLPDTFSWQGAVGFGVALTGVKLLHELGHAFTAKRFGCRVPVMGVAFLVLLPMAFTDTNEVWKLSDRRQRLAVAAAGVAVELIVAIWATLAWGLLPEGLPKSMAFILATTTWIATLAINISPFMRFDGYFLLSDWLEMPNLHARSFALARWDLRERLFDLGLEPPEHFAPKKNTALMLFAYATWIYRLTIFLGIAALVYSFFIKALGILLFVVEIGWFVVLPLWQEIRQWPALLLKDPTPRPFLSNVRNALGHRPRVRRSAFIALIMLLLIMVPWPTRLTASGYLKPVDTYPIHAPAGAQVARLPWAEGSAIPAGAVMIELASPLLQLSWRKAQARLERVRQQFSNAGVAADQRQNLQVLQQEHNTQLAEVANIEAEMTLYAPKAPFAGILRNLDPELKPGIWVTARERLAVLVKPGQWQVETYLNEDDVRRIKIGDGARFYTDGLEGPALTLEVNAIEQDVTRILQNGQLASQFGGSVMSREKYSQLVPDRAMYRVTLSCKDDPGSLSSQSWRGHVVIRGEWEAPGISFLRSVLVLVWRELGF